MINVALLAVSALALGADGREFEVERQVRCSPDGESVTSVVPHAPRVGASRGGGASAGETEWEQVTVPPGIYLRAIAMASAQVGFAAGELGRVIRTVDGGDTWQNVLNQGFPYYYYGCDAIDEQRVVISGFNNSSGEGIVRFSDDAGVTWGPVISLPNPGFTDWLAHVEFTDADHGIVEAAWSGGVHRTASGGRTAGDWTYVEASPGNWFLGTFTYLPDGRVWVAGIDIVYSEDGGQTFDLLPSTNAIFDGPISIRDTGSGYVGGGTISPSVSGWIYRTTDGGGSWTPAPVAAPAYPVRGLLALDEQRAWAAGGNIFSNVGGIVGTSDGGATWQVEQNVGNEMIDLDSVRVDDQFVDIYAAGYVSQIWRRRVVAPVAPPCPWDLDRDGATGITDLLSLLAQWATNPGGPPDFDGDGSVGITDLLALLANWGPC